MSSALADLVCDSPWCWEILAAMWAAVLALLRHAIRRDLERGGRR